MMPPFVVLPALIPDIASVYDVYFAAFHDNAITQALFPGTSSEDMLNADSEFRKAHTSHLLEYWKDSGTQYTLKCTDADTGRIVGMALWDVYPTPSDWKPGDIGWLDGKQKQHAEALIEPLWAARQKYWDEKEYVYCHVTAVHPDYQRRGIGRLLTEAGMRIAEQAKLPVYLESSGEGKGLYNKLGFRELSEKVIHKANDLGVEKDAEIPLMTYIPWGAENKVPANIELA